MRDDALLALQFWRDADRGAPWRARVTDLRDGSVATFVDVAALLRYLSEAFGAEGGVEAGVEARAPSPAEADRADVGDA
jgi:hypothetical protein